MENSNNRIVWCDVRRKILIGQSSLQRGAGEKNRKTITSGNGVCCFAHENGLAAACLPAQKAQPSAQGR